MSERKRFEILVQNGSIVSFFAATDSPETLKDLVNVLKITDADLNLMYLDDSEKSEIIALTDEQINNYL